MMDGSEPLMYFLTSGQCSKRIESKLNENELIVKRKISYVTFNFQLLTHRNISTILIRRLMGYLTSQTTE